MESQSQQKFCFTRRSTAGRLVAIAAIFIALGNLQLSSATAQEVPAIDDQWTKQAPEGSNAEFMMPNKPRLSERKFRPVADQPFINVKTYLCTADEGQVVFTMSYHDLHQRPTSQQDINKTLNGAMRGTVALVLGSLQSDENTKIRTYPGRKFTFSFVVNDQSLKSDAEIYLIGKRLYTLSVIFKQAKYDPALSAKYFATFNPFDPEEAVSSEDDTATADAPTGLENFSLPSGGTAVELK